AACAAKSHLIRYNCFPPPSASDWMRRACELANGCEPRHDRRSASYQDTLYLRAFANTVACCPTTGAHQQRSPMTMSHRANDTGPGRVGQNYRSGRKAVKRVACDV